MTVETYNMTVEEIAHFNSDATGKSYIVINQTYWYDAEKYTDETAAAAYMKMITVKTMSVTGYIKSYCDSKYSVFLEKVTSGVLETRGTEFEPYHDVTRYYDAERNIEIEDRFYIGE